MAKFKEDELSYIVLSKPKNVTKQAIKPTPLTLRFEVSVPPEYAAGLPGWGEDITLTFKSGHHPFPTGQLKEFIKDFCSYMAECCDILRRDVTCIEVRGGYEGEWKRKFHPEREEEDI